MSAICFNLDQSKILSSGNVLTLHHTISTFNDPRKKPVENIVGKGFLLFPQCFLPFPQQISMFQSHLFYSLQMLSIWTSLKFCHLVKSLSFSPFPHSFLSFLKQFSFNPYKPWFLRVCSSSLLNTLWEKEKNEQFLLFLQCFLSIWRSFLPFSSNM